MFWTWLLRYVLFCVICYSVIALFMNRTRRC
jgi:hypothetical protein